MKKIIGKVLCFLGLHAWRDFEGVSGRSYQRCRRCPKIKEIKSSIKEAPTLSTTIPQKRESRTFDYPNMPMYQPCPRCHKGSKRQGKTRGGANYFCPTYGEFFVRGAV